MDLENVTAELRPRGEWEAADFGVRMVRRDAAAIYRVWFAITLPLLFLSLLITVYSPYPVLGALIYWWMEPVADGPILRIVARRLFGEDANVRAALRSTASIAWQNRIFLITPYRFHFARSVAMPITQLEGLSGPERRARAKVLNRKIQNHGVGITVAYQHLVLALYLGLFLIGLALVPTAYQDSLGADWIAFFWEDSSNLASALSLLAWYVAQSALQPWYVGAGFGLYINCRTQLEAWDIEVAFRRIIQRRLGATAIAVVLAMLIVPTVLFPGTSFSQDPIETEQEDDLGFDPGFGGSWSDDQVQHMLEAVFASDALKETQEVTSWQSRDPDQPEPEDDSASTNWLTDLLRILAGAVALVVEFGLWIAVALLLYLLIATRKLWLPYLGTPAYSKPATRRVVLAGGEVSADELPDDVPAEVTRLWNKGEKRPALGLLYRACVFASVTRHGVRLPASATEGECLHAVTAQVDQQKSDYFYRVVSVWIRCAYGFQEPDDATVQPLCNEWHRHYGEAT